MRVAGARDLGRSNCAADGGDVVQGLCHTSINRTVPAPVDKNNNMRLFRICARKAPGKVVITREKVGFLRCRENVGWPQGSRFRSISRAVQDDAVLDRAQEDVIALVQSGNHSPN